MKEFFTWCSDMANSIEDGSTVQNKGMVEQPSLDKDKIIEEYKKQIFHKALSKWNSYYTHSPDSVVDSKVFASMFFSALLNGKEVALFSDNSLLLYYQWMKANYK